jgi:hypothetical protein
MRWTSLPLVLPHITVVTFTYYYYYYYYCWASVANAPNVLQPYWLIVLPLDVPALTASFLYEILAARCEIIYRPKDVATLSTSSALLLPLSRESWSFRPVILDFYQLSPLVVFKRS